MSAPEAPAGGPPRPLPPATLNDRVGAWFRWFGVTRLVAAAISTAIVVGGGWWLVRAPALPAEQSLPVASEVASASTLPPPVAATSVDVPASTEPAAAVVHVAGAVATPGVYTLPAGSRIDDAIDAAGGATAAADSDGLNRAAPLVDGQRVYVPERGEVDPAAVAAMPPSEQVIASASSAPVGPIDINRADRPKLEELPGIGPATASAIIDDRQANGPFASVDELERVRGIGPAKLARLRELVTV